MDRFISSSYYQPNQQILVNLAIVSIVFALAYGYLQIYFVNSGFVLIKATSIILLAMMVKFFNLNDRLLGKLLITALLCHTMGDVVIEYAISLVYSIPFFFMGHVLYSLILLRTIINNFRPSIWRFLLVLMLAMPALYVANMMLSHSSGLLFTSILMYIGVLAVLACSAALHPACFKFLIVGVALYIISDSIIAYHKLVQDIDFQVFISWPFYYMAQFIIICSLLNHERKVS